MQSVSADYLRMLSGSHRQYVTADAWFAGRLVYRNLPIVDGSVSSSTGQEVRSTLTLTVRDPDGHLTPTVDGALSPYGGEIAIRAGMRRGSIIESVPLGRFVIMDPESSEQWKTYTGKGGSRTAVKRGGETQLSGSDRMVLVQDQSFLTRTQPAQVTVFAECRRILQGVVPWRAPAGVADKTLTANAVTYSEDRAAALTDLLDLVGCEPHADPLGVITAALKVPPLTSVYTIPRGAGGQLISMQRKLSRTGMHNGVIAQGTAFTGAPLRGFAVEQTGPLRWGGPFGKVPAYVDAPLATSQADINAAASAALTAERRTRWQEIGVQIVTNYSLQSGDVITVPTPKGQITGPITQITYPLKPTATMSISMSVDPFVLARVA